MQIHAGIIYVRSVLLELLFLRALAEALHNCFDNSGSGNSAAISCREQSLEGNGIAPDPILILGILIDFLLTF